ncbi:MAG TPA: DegQ family serine endoprotease, partial [Beijerinckiaceae bacterium]|nr:DegQ family serine endoprotease [Beijerinckiaceae bacterium]
VHRAAPAVVNVYGARVERRQQHMDDFFRRFFGEGGSGMPRERMQRSLGSGVIVDPSGLVVTNHHVIENMTEVKVSLSDRREFEAEIVLRDPRTDLAVLKLKGASNLAALEIGDSETLQVGDIVLAIGNPFGVGQTVTQGIVSALARTQVGITDYQFFIQTDAAINPGNSGGALIDIHGRLIGINTAIYSRSGGSQGIGFAVPSSMAKAVAESAKAGSRTVRRPWLGARLQSVDRDLAESIGLERPAGVLVSAVYEKGPAFEAGLRRNDVILEVDGQNVDDPDAFGYRFALKGLAGQTNLTVLRGGKRTMLQVKLQSPPETRPREPVKIRGRSPLGGATAMNMSPAVADELQLDAATDGVVIADIEEGSVAGRVGFQKGDLILAINGERVNTSKDLERIVRGNSQAWRITINRGGQVITSVLGG